MGDQGACALASSPHLAGLNLLAIGDNRITDKGVCALASSPYLRSLTDLDLSDNPIGDEGALALAAAPHLAGLKFLHLGQIDRELISETGLTALSARFPQRFHYH